MKQTFKILFGSLIILSIFTIVIAFIGASRYQEINDSVLLFMITVLLAIILFSFYIITDKEK